VTASADKTPARKPPRPRRTPKFVLPEHHRDEQESDRADEHIEAFLAAPVTPRRRRHKAMGRVRRPVEIDTSADWTAALQREGARHARYGRPASVLLIELTGHPVGAADDGMARGVAEAIRAEARETDRAVRLGGRSFRLLLPETGDRQARTVADRIGRAFAAHQDAASPGADLTIDVATAARHAALEDVLAEAERRLAARMASP